MKKLQWSEIVETFCVFYLHDTLKFIPASQPVAEVLAYLHVQISPISCNVVGSILHVLE